MRVGEREVTEQPAESNVRLVGEMLTPEEQDLPCVEGSLNRIHGLRFERLGDVDSSDLGADAGGCRQDVELC